MRPSVDASQEVPQRLEDLSVASKTAGEQKECNKNAKLEAGELVLAHKDFIFS